MSVADRIYLPPHVSVSRYELPEGGSSLVMPVEHTDGWVSRHWRFDVQKNRQGEVAARYATQNLGGFTVDLALGRTGQIERPLRLEEVAQFVHVAVHQTTDLILVDEMIRHGESLLEQERKGLEQIGSWLNASRDVLFADPAEF